MPDNNEEEFTPKLFSEDQSFELDDKIETKNHENSNTEQLFDQDMNEEDDFEIPAFLRKQKF